MFTSRTASVRRISSLQNGPVALPRESRTRMGTSMPSPRATLAWPDRTAFSQPARSGKAMGGRYLSSRAHSPSAELLMVRQ